MDNFFMQHVKDTTPSMNMDILNGLAVKMIPRSVEQLNNIIESVAKDFIPGLKYKGIEYCSPEEELRKINPKKNDKYVIETAKSSFHLIKILFSYTDPRAIDVRTGRALNKEEMLEPCYTYIPYTEYHTAGMIYISGARYFASPVLADVVLSFEKDCIFLNLLRAKFSIKDTRHRVARNGIHLEYKVLWSSIYHLDPKDTNERIETKPLSTLAHYLFGFMGFYETFQTFGKCRPIVGGKEINHDNYPKDQYYIFESARHKLKGIKNQLFSPIKLAIRHTELNNTTEGLIAAFFYTLDHFPDYFKNVEWIDNKDKWRLMLGYVIFGRSRNAGSVLEMIDDHYKSLNQYLDTIVKYKLELSGIFVDSIYEFFAHAIENYNDWSIKSKENLNSIYNKELSILHYVLKPVVESINMFYFRLKSASKIADKRPITKEDLNKLLRITIKPRKIFGIKKTPSSLTTMSYSGNNKFKKITSNIIPQNSLSSTGSKDVDIYDPMNRLHTSFMAVGSNINLPKSSPIGYKTVSPYVQLDSDNKFIIPEQEREFLENMQEIIRRK
jgi:hypothetical protein